MKNNYNYSKHFFLLKLTILSYEYSRCATSTREHFFNLSNPIENSIFKWQMEQNWIKTKIVRPECATSINVVILCFVISNRYVLYVLMTSILFNSFKWNLLVILITINFSYLTTKRSKRPPSKYFIYSTRHHD